MQALASQQGLGTCAKLCSVASAMRCALHLLMFCFALLCKLTIPKRRETTLPFPAWDARNHWSKIPSAPLVRNRSRNTGRTCDRYFLGTHRCLELAYPLAFGEKLFPGVIVAVLFAPSHPAPLAQSSSSNAETALSSTFGAALVLSSLLSLREQTSRVACPGCLLSPGRTSREERCSSCPVERETACDALHSIAAEAGHTDRTFVAIRTNLVLVMA